MLVKFSPMKNRLHQGMIIPPSDLTPCGRLTATPEQFYLSACDEADRLKNEMDLAAESTILALRCFEWVIASWADLAESAALRLFKVEAG